MSKYSRRKIRIEPDFDTLEGRDLLSRFAGSMAPDWGGSVGHDGAPPTSFAMMSNGSPRSFGGRPDTWVQGRSFERNGWPPRDMGPIPNNAPSTPVSPAGPFPQADALRGRPADLVPDQPLLVSITIQVTAPASDPGLRLPPSSARADSVERAIGPMSAGPTKATASENFVILIAPVGEPRAATPFATQAGDDPLVGPPPPPPGPPGSARSVNVGLSPTAPAALAPPWTTPADPVPRGPETAPPPVAVSGGNEASDGSAGISPDNLPAPRGADLISDLAASLHAPIEDPLTGLLDRFGGLREPLKQPARGDSYLFPVAVAVVALEVARRRRRRSTTEARPSRRSRNFGMYGLL
jgi:hypothetical protein